MPVNQDDYLTPAIRDLFGHYEESYEAGAWENFAEQYRQPEKRSWRVPFLKVAALLAITMHLLPLSINHSDLPLNAHAMSAKKNPLVVYAEKKVEKGVNLEPAALFSKVKLTGEIKKHSLSVSKLPVSINQIVLPEKLSLLNAEVDEINQSTASEETSLATADGKSLNKSNIDELFLAGKESELPISRKTSKWSLSIELASGAGSSKMNLSSGINTQYQLSDKIALRSGISYAEHNSSVSQQEITGSLVGKQLLSNNASLAVLDIPLNVVYKANSNFYTSVGFSFLTVLDEKRRDDYMADIPTQSSAVDPGTGKEVTLSRTIRMKISENAAEQSLKGHNYLGFGNLSVGRAQKVFGDQEIQIEPYVKLPIGRLAERDLKLTTGGVKFIWKLKK